MLVLVLVVVLAVVIISKGMGWRAPEVLSESLPITPKEEAPDVDMLSVCKTHPLVLDFLKQNEGSRLTVGADPGTYEALYTCVVTIPESIDTSGNPVPDKSIVFPFVRVK